MPRITLILSFLFYALSSLAQTEDYPGTWKMRFQSADAVINMQLEVGLPEKNILYPAQLTIQCDSFKTVYELMIVKKNMRQLGISKNKFPRSSETFSIGDWTIVLNGTLDYSRDLKGESLLTINRLPAKRYGTVFPDFITLTDIQKRTAAKLTRFLKDEEIILKKINNIPWDNEYTGKILIPQLSPAYFGLIDTIHLHTNDGVIHFSGNKKNSNDIVSVVLNGKTIIDQVYAGEKKDKEDILLDTGLNIVTFFADNFNKSAPNKAKANFEFGDRKFKLDFSNKPDVAATFIVVKLYYDYDKNASTRFETLYIPYPGDSSLKRNDKVVGSLVSTSQQITLALWDDAVEDGDSVSININGRWIVQGFPVKKMAQFLTVKLDPGPNTITFVADNLGSIPPNTSVLEIIDGKKRKSFNIETSLDQNNLLKIFYEYKPD